MQSLSGQVIKTYEIREQIGAGGFGAVYLATQPVVNRDVALKVILPQHANQPDFVRRFETEAQLVARLEHPHIVPLYDYWRDPKGAYLVMRYLRGGSLRDSLEETGAWSLTQTARMLNQIAAALSFAHNHSVIHRDLKSDNILMDEASNSYLGDFGIAKDIIRQENLTKDSILGTPAYLSPEQIRGEDATARSDIYALGILVYETLTATKPFFDVTPATVLFKQLHDSLPDIHDLRPDLPEEINTVLQRATAKDAPDRYQTTLEFARDFQTVVRSVQSPDATTDIYPSSTVDMISITRVEQEAFEPINPYKGLRAFQTADAGDFYGRSALIDRLMSSLDRKQDNADFLAVVGPSGSGKSSVVRAGILPRLQRGALDEELNWYVADMVPGTHPLEELEAALLTVATQEMPGLLEQLKTDTRGLVRAIKRMFKDTSEHLVLFIDQFEETFTLIDDEATRVHFLDLLMEAIQDARGHITVIITMRADFYDRPLHYEKFGELVRQRTELVLPLSTDELEEAITRPAENVGVSLEPGLASAMINDVQNQPGALPLLQYALTELFERRSGRLLTFDGYQDIGGTSGALARRAEELYRSFSDDEKFVTRQMFLRLVTPGEGTEDTRRRILQSELLSIDGDARYMEQVIEQFGKYRLLTFDRDPSTRSSTIEVAHEALIRQWERLRGWLDENREGLRLHRWLNQSANDWDAHQRPTDFLARGIRLERLEEWSIDSTIALNDLEATYLNASIAARKEREDAERIRQEREEELERQAQNRLRILAVFSAIAALGGAILAALAISGESRAVENANLALIAQAVAEQNEAVALEARNNARGLALAASARNARLENEPPLALALIQEALVAAPSPGAEVRRTVASIAYAPGIRDRFTSHQKSVTAVDYSSDGQYSASVSLDNSLQIYDLNENSLLRTIALPELFVTDVAVNPVDNSTIITTFKDGTVRLYDFETGDELLVIDAHENGATSIAFMPDGQQAISGGEDKIARLWDLQTGDEIRAFEGHRGVILRVAISTDGRTLATSSGSETLANKPEDEKESNVRIWNISDGSPERIITPASGFVRALDFSPDGNFVAIGVWDSEDAGTIRIYDLLNGFERYRLFAHPNVISEVVFSPDGQFIASVAWDRVIRIWDIERTTNVQSFIGFPERILSMTYSPDGEHLLLGAGNYGNNTFDIDNEQALDSSIWVLDLKSRDERRSFNQHEDWLWTVALSPDETRAASGSGPLRLNEDNPLIHDLSIRIWDINTGEEQQRLVGHQNVVDSVQFLPDNERLLSSGWDGQILLWDIDSAEILRSYDGHEGAVYRVTLNTDGSRFLSAGADGTVHLWDIETGEILQTYTPDDADEAPRFNFVNYSPDETQIVASGSDGIIRVWNAEDASLIRTLEGHTGSVNEVIFSPDGMFIASSSWDDTVRLWSVESGNELRKFDHNANTFGLAFTQDSTILLVTSENTNIHMWDVATGNELHRYTAHNDWIQEVVISQDGTFAVSAGQDKTAKVWRIDRTIADLQTFMRNNRYARDLSCTERERYDTVFVCQPDSEVE